MGIESHRVFVDGNVVFPMIQEASSPRGNGEKQQRKFAFGRQNSEVQDGKREASKAPSYALGGMDVFKSKIEKVEDPREDGGSLATAYVHMLLIAHTELNVTQDLIFHDCRWADMDMDQIIEECARVLSDETKENVL